MKTIAYQIFKVLLLTALFAFSISVNAQALSNVNVSVEKWFDGFIDDFRQSQDIGQILDWYASAKLKKNIEDGTAPFADVDSRLFHTQSVSTRRRLFVAELNYLYIGSAYTFAKGKNLGTLTKEEVKFPTDVRHYAEKSLFVRDMFGFGDVSKVRTFNSGGDLDRYTKELEEITLLLRNHLSHKFYDTRTYKYNYSIFVQKADKYARPNIWVLDGHPEYSIPSGIAVFGVNRDIFSMYLIKEGETYKILDFIVGN